MNPTYIKILNKARLRKGLPMLEGVAFTGETLIATDLEHAAIVDYKSETKGVYGNFQALLTNEDLADHLKIGDLEDYPELPKIPETGFEPLEDLDKILEAGKTISKDTTRPVLTVVCVEDGHIHATDGYSAYYAPTKNVQPLRLDKTMLDMLKLGKKLAWTYAISDDQLFLQADGITLMSKQVSGQYPNLQAIMPKGQVVQSAKFNFKELKQALKNFNTDYFTISPRGLSAVANWDGRGPLPKETIPTGVAAEIAADQPNSEIRRIFMPMSAKYTQDDDAYAVMDVRVLEKVATADPTVYVYERIAEVA